MTVHVRKFTRVAIEPIPSGAVKVPKPVSDALANLNESIAVATEKSDALAVAHADVLAAESHDANAARAAIAAGQVVPPVTKPAAEAAEDEAQRVYDLAVELVENAQRDYLVAVLAARDGGWGADMADEIVQRREALAKSFDALHDEALEYLQAEAILRGVDSAFLQDKTRDGRRPLTKGALLTFSVPRSLGRRILHGLIDVKAATFSEPTPMKVNRPEWRRAA